MTSVIVENTECMRVALRVPIAVVEVRETNQYRAKLDFQ